MGEDILNKIRAMNCFVCMARPPSDAHHWRTKGAGGQDHEDNLVPLCRKHHVEFHNKGRKTFFSEYGDRINVFRKMKRMKPLEA